MRILLLMAPLILTLLPTAQAEDLADGISKARFHECFKKVHHREYDLNCVNDLLAVEEKYNLCHHCDGMENACTVYCKAGIWKGAGDLGPGGWGKKWSACCDNPDSKVEHAKQKYLASEECWKMDGRPCPR